MVRNALKFVLAPIALAAIAAGAFFTVRDSLGSPAPPRNDKLIDALLADAAKPTFAGKIGPLTILDTASGPQYPCGRDLTLVPDYSPARGTQLAIEPSYLPASDVEYEHGAVNLCDKTLISSARQWQSTQYGGPIIRIRKFIRPAPWITEVTAPADRISTGTVKGKPAVIVRHVIEDQGMVRGNSGLFWADKLSDGNYLVTAVYGEQIRIDDLMRVAEGLK